MKPLCFSRLYYPVTYCGQVFMLNVQSKGNHLGLGLNHPGMEVPTMERKRFWQHWVPLDPNLPEVDVNLQQGIGPVVTFLAT